MQVLWLHGKNSPHGATLTPKHYFIIFHHRGNVGKYNFKYHFPIKPPYCLLGYYYGKPFVNFYTPRNM